MIIVGCDFHPRWQQVAIFDPVTGEIVERKLINGNGEAEEFYGSLPVPSLVGVESCGNSQWFLELMEQLGHEVWVGDAAQIRASYVRKQKTDRRDAGHILKLLLEGRSPEGGTMIAQRVNAGYTLNGSESRRCVCHSSRSVQRANDSSPV
jgi:transposase